MRRHKILYYEQQLSRLSISCNNFFSIYFGSDNDPSLTLLAFFSFFVTNEFADCNICIEKQALDYIAIFSRDKPAK
jgi:hypothetical protein